ncbi:hypothetical protein NG798_22795 [Ancylothrix sp. C2]|uniref:hypothetical protein n=1 Tax=Ancylothrix sp. D3o TaxID=2953691 RepID=UPI0021BB1C3D|nr:hypothetical protein [Ancylothrix sp. D3o]MCT7952630.1 hypothetical protein [Ancylothrix sp. D3o]
MTQELRNLRNSILEGRYDDALSIVDELESMSKEDKINNIQSYVIRILIHLIKIHIEQRLTNSGRALISQSVNRIKRLNLKDSKNSYYLKPGEWEKMLKNSIEESIDLASVEVLDGTLKPERISELIDKNQILETAQQFLYLTYECSGNELTQIIRHKLAQLSSVKKWQHRD